MSKSGWSIAPLQHSDVEDFVKAQFVAFVGNSLHDVVYPTPQASIDTQRKVLAGRSSLPADTEIVYLKAVDDATGQIVGGIKVCYYSSESVKTESPYPPGKSADEAGLPDDERYNRWVVGSFLGRRIELIKYPHALIDLLFVHPDHHRRGIGGGLVARSMAIADEKGLPAIVEASPQGKATYEKCGFVSKEPVTIVSERWPGRDDNLYYWMERKAAGS